MEDECWKKLSIALDRPAHFLYSHALQVSLQKIESWPSSFCVESLMVSRHTEQVYPAFTCTHLSGTRARNMLRALLRWHLVKEEYN